MRCAVVNCNKSNEGKASVCSFFRFPTDVTLQKKWLSFCGRKIFNPNTSFVCMHHFQQEDFGNNLQYEMGFAKKRLLKEHVVPTINLACIKSNELHEQRARRTKRRKNRNTVNLLLKNHNSGLIFSEGNSSLQSIETIDIENDVDAMENIDEIQGHQPEKQSEEILSADVSTFHNLNLKVESLEKEILVLSQENQNNEAALKAMKDKMEKMEKNHKNDQKEMQKCLGKAKMELAGIEEKLQGIFTEDQISNFKNSARINPQTWSKDEAAYCITLYAVSPKMYRRLYKKQFPLPAVPIIHRWAQKLQVSKRLLEPKSRRY